ncbi:MAG TPA: DUF4867 domain-containing protein [Ruminococcaceae bacterium]|jgi:hypothetical protein|nr:DUF4867 domain-containing protein [Oscillospiraceae bacterium]
MPQQSCLEALRRKNPNIPFYDVFDPAFAPYGRIVQGYDWKEALDFMECTEIPAQGSVYLAKVPALMSLSVAEELRRGLYGEMPVQVGYCNGNNRQLNALEYHKCPEVDAAATDLILLLGDVRDIRGGSYPSSAVKAFYLPKGTACELYATTLHFAPCRVRREGFRCIVVLADGTNLPLESPHSIRNPEDRLLFLRNKWLIAHPESVQAQKSGAFPGISGENIAVISE